MTRLHWRRHERPGAAPREVEVRDPAASMALIFDAMRHPIDPSYADSAARREAQGAPARSWRRSPLLIISLLLIGLMVGAAAHALRVPRAVAQDRHAQLVDQIETKQSDNDDASAELTRRRDDVASAQKGALDRQSQAGLKKTLDDATRTAGLAEVRGPGVVMTVSNPDTKDADSADSDPRTGTTAQAITSSDLQQLVNGWWQAGATGISINGQRVTSMTAIRFAGSAVLVNFRPLTPPYEISVMGPDDMQKTFTGSFADQYAASLRKSGFGVTSNASNDVDLPALDSVHVTHARIVP